MSEKINVSIVSRILSSTPVAHAPDRQNQSADPEVEKRLNAAISIASVLLLLFLCLLCNALVLTAIKSSKIKSTPRSRGYRLANIDTLLVVVAIISIINGLVATAFQVVSFSYDEWIFGEPLCQFQGFLTNLLNFCIIWYIALLSFERYTHRLQPQEYPLTLSRLNLKVILVGIFFLLLTAVSGPIYGWGQYTYIAELGLCELNMTSHNIVTYFGLSLGVYDILPYVLSGFWYCQLIIRHEPSLCMISKDDANSLFEGRCNIYAFAASSLSSLIFGAPSYVTNVLQCCGYRFDALHTLLFWWLRSFSLVCCYQICCICFCGRLRHHIYYVILCSLKAKCKNLTLPVSATRHPPLTVDAG